MGEYYNWVNVDKKEYISPSDFGYGSKFHESLHKDSVPRIIETKTPCILGGFELWHHGEPVCIRMMLQKM